MYNIYHAYKPVGTITYYVNGEKFISEKGTRNGKIKAETYCFENGIDLKHIIKFDSMLECARYEFLLSERAKGNISNLEHHKEIELIPEFTNANGELIKRQSYVADFVYHDNNQNLAVYEDVKGASLFQDTRFEIVKTLFDFKFRQYNVYLKIIIKKNNEWVEYHPGEIKKSRTLINKQKEALKKAKTELHDKEVKARKIARIRALYVKYRGLEKLTKKQREKFVEYEEFLKKEGLIL